MQLNDADVTACHTADGKAEPVTATAAAAERGAPIQKFKIYNEQWLDQSEDIAEDFVDTPAMARLKAGHFGDRPVHPRSRAMSPPYPAQTRLRQGLGKPWSR